MRIGVDVMGGDNAPHEILKGSIDAIEILGDGDTLVLAGNRQVIEEGLSERGVAGDRIEILECGESIGMDESPVEAVRAKRDSSIAKLSKLAGPKAAPEEHLDAWISAGNTGACVTAAQMNMRRLRNVIRPGVAVTVPTFGGPVILIDVGANIQPKPPHLAQYGVMGAIYGKKLLNMDNPRVGLMNVGGEEAKGTSGLKRARELLLETEGIDFVGYVEGRGVFDGEAEVVVTDGIVGNVMIKLAEGLSSGIFKAIAAEVMEVDPELALRFEPVVKNLYARHDYHEYGGAPLLGVNGVCMISHGSSVARTITNAVKRSLQFVTSGVNEAIADALEASSKAFSEEANA